MGIETRIEETKTGWIPRHEPFVQKYVHYLPQGCALIVRGMLGSNWEVLMKVLWQPDLIDLGETDSLEDAMEDAPVAGRNWVQNYIREKKELVLALDAMAGVEQPEQVKCVCGSDGSVVPIEFDGEALVHKWIPGCELVKAKAEIAALVALAKAQESLLAAYRTGSNQRSGASAATKVRDAKAKLAALGIEL